MSWPGPQRGGEGVGGGLDVGQVRLLVLAERGGHADQHRVRLAEAGHIGRRLEPVGASHLADEVLAEVLEVVLPAAEHLDLPRVHVEAEDAKAGVEERADQRQPDVPERQHPDHGRAVVDLLPQVGCIHWQMIKGR